MIPILHQILLKVYDTTRSFVTILDQGFKDAGEYSAYFDGRSHASGVNYINLESGTYRRTIKMMLTKRALFIRTI